MNAQESEQLWHLVRTLQRQPEPVDDAEAQRALTVLMASRRDAPLLLLQRVLVLEAALSQVRAAQADAAQASAVAGTAGDTPPAEAPRRGRTSPFLRDASVIAAGVVGGGLVLGALDTLGESLSGFDDLL
jgi:hypothetical protein